MVNFTPRPHVSAALSHLRAGVTGAATALALCAAIQLLIFGFVHFTTLRYAQVTRNPLPIQVVAPTRASAGPNAAPTSGAAPALAPFTPLATPKVVGEWDVRLRTVSDMTTSAAVISGILLAVFCCLGVAIAGGASVPGVERAVSAATWAMLVAAACLPWQDLMPSMLFKGAFGDYATMTTLSEEVDAGAASPFPLLASYLVTPLAALCGSLLVLGRFRAGVAEGVIVTSISELDERLEREIAGIRTSGVAGSNTRAIAALNHAIGDKPEPAGAKELVANGAGAEGAPRKRGVSLSRMGRGWMASEDEEFKRPI
jgi:hypothetical protein